MVGPRLPTGAESTYAFTLLTPDGVPICWVGPVAMKARSGRPRPDASVELRIIGYRTAATWGWL